MFRLMQQVLAQDSLPQSWFMAIVTMIPKEASIPMLDMLRRIALQTVLREWITSVILIQLEDILQQQKGFFKQRSILDHIYGP